jgi:hypothetical protein
MVRFRFLLLIGCLLMAGVACHAGTGSRIGGDTPEPNPLPTLASPAQPPDAPGDRAPLPTLFPTATATPPAAASVPADNSAPAATPAETPPPSAVPEDIDLSRGDVLLDLLDNLATANAEADDLSDIDELK